MKPELFRITLDNPSKNFRPGSTVSGFVELKLKTDTDIHAVVLTCAGRVFTAVSISKHHYFKNEQNIHIEKDVTLRGQLKMTAVQPSITDCKGQLLRTLNQGRVEKTTLAAGRHRFAFSFALPPTSKSNSNERVQSPNDFTSYTLKARIVRSWHFDIVSKESFIVLQNASTSNSPTKSTKNRNCVIQNNLLHAKSQKLIKISLTRPVSNKIRKGQTPNTMKTSEARKMLAVRYILLGQGKIAPVGRTTDHKVKLHMQAANQPRMRKVRFTVAVLKS